MTEQPRTQSDCPIPEMEGMFLDLIGIKDETDEIERQRELAIKENVDWLIHLRELGEAIQLLKTIGLARFTEVKIWPRNTLAFLIRKEEKGKLPCLKAVSTMQMMPFTPIAAHCPYTQDIFPFKSDVKELGKMVPIESLDHDKIHELFLRHGAGK